MKSTTAMYIGSFDPFTLGHLNIVEKALTAQTENRPAYDKLIICVGKNDAKELFLKPQQRKNLIESAVAKLPRANDITVIISDELTVDIAYNYGVTTLIRGIRPNSIDLYSEKELAETNRFLAAMRGFSLKTEFITQNDPFLQTVSSSLVRKLYKMDEYIAMVRLLPQCIAEDLLAPKLHKEFEKLVKKSNTSIRNDSFIKSSEAYWGDVKTAYKARPYHNLIHLAYMLNLLAIYKHHRKEAGDYTSSEPSKNLLMAIFMHDYVYDVSPKEHPLNNEQCSANTALCWCRKQVFNTDISGITVHELIMATTHEPKEDLTDEQKLIADLDLSILGTADTATYNAYAAGIRKEYAAYSDEKYKTERLAFLFALLKRKHIFHLPFFRNMFEEQARKNITMEIKYLHGKA